MKLIDIEEILNYFELKISLFSWQLEGKLGLITLVPGVLLVPGALKSLLGITQLTASLALLALSPLTLLYKKEPFYSLVEHSFEHLLHGIGNFYAGIFESIPLIAHLGVLIRGLKERKACSLDSANFMKAPSFKVMSCINGLKFMQYKSLETYHLKTWYKTHSKEYCGYKEFLPSDNVAVKYFLYDIEKSHPNASLEKINELFETKLMQANEGTVPSNLIGYGIPLSSPTSTKLFKFDHNQDSITKLYELKGSPLGKDCTIDQIEGIPLERLPPQLENE